MLQTLHLAQNEFISACGNSEWRDSVIKSLDANYDYRFPSATHPPAPPNPSRNPPPSQHRHRGPKRKPRPPHRKPRCHKNKPAPTVNFATTFSSTNRLSP